MTTIEEELKLRGQSLCKVNIDAQSNDPCMGIVAGTATCPVCGEPMCPVCNRHKVSQISRVTGYVSDVGGWNAAKKQELIDRKHYDIKR